MSFSLDLKVVFFILIVHWFADFVFQSDYEAKNKSKSNYALLSHIITYSFVFWLSLILFHGVADLNDFIKIANFTVVTFIFHFITDYLTSRLNTQLWESGNVHNFFVSIGFDQVLHYFQLFFTYWYLFA